MLSLRKANKMKDRLTLLEIQRIYEEYGYCAFIQRGRIVRFEREERPSQCAAERSRAHAV